MRYSIAPRARCGRTSTESWGKSRLRRFCRTSAPLPAAKSAVFAACVGRYMALSEFALIERYFRRCGAQRSDVRLGVGDDAALLGVPAGSELVAAIDTLVAGVHFPHGSPPASIGHRALAVNLSDLAAMGARPAWALLALTLPQAEEPWLEEFATG